MIEKVIQLDRKVTKATQLDRKITTAVTVARPVVTVTISETNDVQGATVTINGHTFQTDANGEVQLNLFTWNNYDYTITKTGYKTYTGTLNVEDTNFTESVTLSLESLTWVTDETGVFGGSIRMTTGPMQVDWGDGIVEEIADGPNNLTHDYGGAEGDKTIIVNLLNGLSDITDINLGYTNSKGDISNWPIPGLINLEQITLRTTRLTGDLTNWEVSNLSNLYWVSLADANFEGDLTNWDISNLTILTRFYIYLNFFSGDLTNWDISKLENLQNFYIGSNSFSGDLSNWDISDLNSLENFSCGHNSITKPIILSKPVAWSGVDFYFADDINISANVLSNYIISLDNYGGSNGETNISGCNGGTMTYSDLSPEAQAAHDNLVNNKGWTITMDT